jgi:hypothetical protein
MPAKKKAKASGSPLGKETSPPKKAKSKVKKTSRGK